MIALRTNRLMIFAVGLTTWALSTAPLQAQSIEIPSDAQAWSALRNRGYQAWLLGNTAWIRPSPSTLEKQRILVPKLNAPIRHIGWTQSTTDGNDIVVAPEPGRWKLSWKNAPANEPVLKIEFDVPPTLPGKSPLPPTTADGSIMLHAYQARTFGKRLRYEPQPFKNTVGYWTDVDDYASWTFQVDQPGTYSVAILQGCGKGQGGSQAKLTVRHRDLVQAEQEFSTTDTGHFQNFRWVQLGNIELSNRGLHGLEIKPLKIAKAALCDIRAVHLVKQASVLPANQDSIRGNGSSTIRIRAGKNK